MEGRRRGPHVAGPHVAGPRWFVEGWEDSPFDYEPESDEGAGSGIADEGTTIITNEGMIV